MELKAGYKQTEVGVIPVDWNAKTLGDVMVHCFSGATPSRSRPDFYKGNIRWITSGELNYNVIEDTAEKISKEAVIRTNLKVLPKNTFLMAITGLEAEGTRGSCGIVGEESTTNQSCMAILPKDELLTEYLFQYYVFKGKSLALKYCQGTKQQSYTAKIVKILPIPLPSIDEQRAIAAALSDVDALIAALDRLIAKKRDIKRATMQELLMGKRRLPGFCEEWESTTFGAAFAFLRTANNSREDLSATDGVGYLHYGDIHTKWRTILDFDLADLPKIDESKVAGLPRLQDGDLIIADASEDYDGVGVAVEVRNIKDQKIIAGLHTLLLRERRSTFVAGFKGHIQYIPEVRSQLVKIATGVSVYSISKGNLADISIPVPSLGEQSAITAVLSDMDAEISALEARREKTVALKYGMMQELLTGRIRLVKGAEA